ncbi:MAG: hypothetical protein PHY66_05805 [Aliarcobacter sp.]|nr:hypothetical protein [Aliarcobacter sp.]
MIDENQKTELFDEFYEWLKNDGLKPFKSERLHKKKIFSSLLNNNQMTIDNFNDFLNDVKRQEIKSLQYLIINYQNELFSIDEVQINDKKEEFVLKNIEQNTSIKCKFSQIKEVKDLIMVVD